MSVKTYNSLVSFWYTINPSYTLSSANPNLPAWLSTVNLASIGSMLPIANPDCTEIAIRR